MPFITFLINLSFNSLSVPNVWKLAKVRALYKGENKLDPNNYRPISVLSTVNKIMEKIVFNSLYEFLVSNKLLSDYQFGFRDRNSCSDLLITLLNKIYSGLNHKKKVVILSLDIRKAFDSISHRILLYKLYRIGFDTKTLLWFT